MPLSMSDAATLANNVTAYLRELGCPTPPGTPSTAMPHSDSNTDAAAYELYLAQRMVTYAEAYKKDAMKAAVETGVIFDHTKSPRLPGADEIIYNGDMVQVHLKTKNGSSKTDWKAVGLALVKAGLVSQKLWDQTVQQHTDQAAAPHTFTASLRV